MNTDLHLLCGVYAVDALDGAERDAFEAHLAECASCLDELATLREAAAALSDLAPIDPPAALRDSVLASITGVRPLPPLPASAVAGPAGDPAGDKTVAASDHDQDDTHLPSLDKHRERSRWSTRTRWGSGLLVAAVAAIAIVTSWHPWSSDQPTDQVQRIIAAADAQRLEQTLPNGGAMTVYRSVSLDQAAVVASGLPDPGAGKVYEVWLQNEAGAMVPAAVLSAEDETTRVVLKGSAAAATAAGVTVEPSGGSPAPTTEPVMLFGFTTK